MRCYFILVPIYVWVLKQGIVKGGRDANYTLLALSKERFRGDLPVLASRCGFNVLALSMAWQARLTDVFYPVTETTWRSMKYYNAEKYPEFSVAKQKCQKFMKGFLPRLYKALGVDAVIVANVRYIPDLDWAYVSQQLSVPCILLFREGLLTTERKFQVPYVRHKSYGIYPGGHIIAHNEVSQKMFIESGFAKPEQVTVAGVLRMDDYLSRVKCYLQKSEGTVSDKIVLFYFRSDDHGLGPEDLFGIYRSVHEAFAELVQEFSQYDFVIKSKAKDLYTDIPRKLYPIYQSLGVDIKALPNLTISSTLDVHDLILSARAIVGYGSTTMLEAAITGKPVIVPFFRALRESDYAQDFCYVNYSDIFTLVDDGVDFKRVLSAAIVQPAQIEETVLQKRHRVFEKYLTSFDCQAHQRYKKCY